MIRSACPSGLSQEGGGEALAPPSFCRTVYAISTRGADYVPHSTTSPPDFHTLRWPCPSSCNGAPRLSSLVLFLFASNSVCISSEHFLSTYSRVQKSIENFVFRPKIAIFLRVEMRKGGLPLSLAFQNLILMSL